LSFGRVQKDVQITKASGGNTLATVLPLRCDDVMAPIRCPVPSSADSGRLQWRKRGQRQEMAELGHCHHQTPGLKAAAEILAL